MDNPDLPPACEYSLSVLLFAFAVLVFQTLVLVGLILLVLWMVGVI